MNSNDDKLTTSDIVKAEAAKLGLEAPADVVKFITALAEAAIEEEIDNLWEFGNRPIGSYTQRFTKYVIEELNAHAQVLRQMARR